MSINKLISIKNAIIDATDMAAIDHGNYLPLFMTWAIYAEKEIGGLSAITKFAVIDICGCTAQLPCDAVEVEGAILGNHSTQCGVLFSNVFSTGAINNTQVSNSFMVVDIGGTPDSSTCIRNMVPYAYQDNKLIFSQSLTETHVTIKYKGIVEDCDGFPLVCENHILAIAEYIRYNWLKRKRKKSQVEYREMQDAFMQWDRLCAHARADDNMLTETQKARIVSMLHDAYSQISLSQNMKLSNYRSYGTVGY